MGRFGVKKNCYINPKVSKMRSIIGHRIDYNLAPAMKVSLETYPPLPPPPRSNRVDHSQDL